MCDPITIMTTVGMATMGMAQARAQAKMASKQAEVSAENATRQYQAERMTSEIERSRANKEYAQQSVDKKVEAQRARSNLLVAIGESGVGGNTPLRQIGETYVKAGIEEGRVRTGYENAVENIRLKQTQSFLNLQGALSGARASVPSAGTQRLAMGASALGGALEGYQIGTSLNKVTPKKTTTKK